MSYVSGEFCSEVVVRSPLSEQYEPWRVSVRDKKYTREYVAFGFVKGNEYFEISSPGVLSQIRFDPEFSEKHTRVARGALALPYFFFFFNRALLPYLACLFNPQWIITYYTIYLTLE